MLIVMDTLQNVLYISAKITYNHDNNSNSQLILDTFAVISDDFCPIFIGNPIFWTPETDNSNGVPILCQIAFSSLSFPFFVRLKLF